MEDLTATPTLHDVSCQCCNRKETSPSPPAPPPSPHPLPPPPPGRNQQRGARDSFMNISMPAAAKSDLAANQNHHRVRIGLSFFQIYSFDIKIQLQQFG